MPNYKDATNKVHFIDDAAFAYLLPAGCVPITDAEAEALQPQAPAPIIVVTPWQIRKALNAAGLREAIEAGVDAADQPTKDAWLYAQEFRRDNPIVSAVATALGKTEAEIDQIFALAVTL